MLTDNEKQVLATINRASGNSNLVVLECTDKKNGERAPVLCAVQFDGKMYEFVPLARLFTGNPDDEVLPPNPDEPEADHAA